jgi:DNA-directed RNA polymerase specialized sigma24 family protein
VASRRPGRPRRADADGYRELHCTASRRSTSRASAGPHPPEHGARQRGVRPPGEAASCAVEAPARETAEVDLLALDVAPKQLEALDPEQGRVVELRFFGGLTVDETAEVMGVSAAS